MKKSESQIIHEALLLLTEKEREITDHILERLFTMETKRLYLELGYSSLDEYCTKALKYSEGTASRYIRASRLIEHLPDCSEQIRDGSLSVCNLAHAHSVIRAEEKRTGQKVKIEAKRKIIKQLEGQTQSQAQVTLALSFPEVTIVQEKKIAQPNGDLAITTIIPATLVKKLQRIRELSSHSNDTNSLLAAIEIAADFYLKHKYPETKALRTTQSFATAAKPSVKTNKHIGSTMTVGKHANDATTASNSKNPRQIANLMSKKKILFRKATSQCEFIHPTTGERCKRRHHLQIDHKIPITKGGGSNIENLQLLCRPHNLQKGAKIIQRLLIRESYPGKNSDWSPIGMRNSER